jgi:hypothetical protein
VGITSADIKVALRRRYNKTSQGNDGEKYVCIEEARSGAGFAGNAGQCDFLAINTWKGAGMELIGHEIKVSMSDWKRELDDPAKSDRFARFCRQWWVVAPSDLASKIVDEIPPVWGLLSVSESGRVTQRIKAPVNRNPDPVPDWFWIGWLAQVDRYHKRHARRIATETTAGERERIRREERERAERIVHLASDRDQDIIRKADRLREQHGIDLRWLSDDEMERLAAAMSSERSIKDVLDAAEQMRRLADRIERRYR